MAGDVVEPPEIAAERLGAELLRQRDALGLGLAVGMIGADRQAKPVAERDDHRLDLAGSIRSQNLEHRRLRQVEKAVAIEHRNRRRPRHADSGQFLDVMAQRRLVAAGPAGDDQRRRLHA